MVPLLDLIALAGVELRGWKLHCATGVGSSPLDAFFAGTFEQWQGEQNQKNFESEQIVSLIHLGKSRWLFAGVFDILGREDGRPGYPEGYTYATREVTGHGGNVELRSLLSVEGRRYAENFSYSILEVCDVDAGDRISTLDPLPRGPAVRHSTRDTISMACP